MKTHTRSGREVEIVCQYYDPILVGGRSIIGIIKVNDGEWAVQSWFADGHWYSQDATKERKDPDDLIEIINIKAETTQPSPKATEIE